MFSFQALCEYLTHNQRYAWFYFCPKLLNIVDTRERDIVYVEIIDDSTIRCFYPASKFWDKPFSIEEFSRLVDKAIETNNNEMLKHLREKAKVMK